jgi:inosine/xanthosine triphosphate pyrophosphatase family protein
MKILFATTNKAKVKFYAARLKEKGIDIVTLDDLILLRM